MSKACCPQETAASAKFTVNDVQPPIGDANIKGVLSTEDRHSRKFAVNVVPPPNTNEKIKSMLSTNYWSIIFGTCVHHFELFLLWISMSYNLIRI